VGILATVTRSGNVVILILSVARGLVSMISMDGTVGRVATVAKP